MAAPGFFCVYEVFDLGMTFQAFAPTASEFITRVEPQGVVLLFLSSNAQGNVRGTWAYTAP